MFFLVADQFWRINEPFHDLMGTGNLVIQFLAIGMLMISIHFKRKGDIIGHGNLMIIAFITNFISFALVMTTGFIYFYVSEPLSYSYQVSLIHGLFGGSAMILSLWLFLPWVIRGSNPMLCARKRLQMKATYFLWIIALLLGLVVWVLDVVLKI